MKIIKFNVAGRHFTISKANILKHPSTRLAQVVSVKQKDAREQCLCDGYLEDSGEYYFDRSPQVFTAIAELYRSAHWHPPTNVCHNLLNSDLRYFAITPPSPCVCTTPTAQSTVLNGKKATELQSTSSYNALKSLTAREDEPPAADSIPLPSYWRKPGRYSRLRLHFWYLVEIPTHSCLAFLFAVISNVLILLTTISIVLESFEPRFACCYSRNQTSCLPDRRSIDPSCLETFTHPALVAIEYLCIAWFTVEYLIRLWVAPKPLRYAVSLYAIIDLLAIAPFYIEQIASAFEADKEIRSYQKGLSVGRILRLMRILRLFRLLKLSRYTEGITMLIETLRRSGGELLMLVLFMCGLSLVFATALFYAEGWKNEKFSTIPETMFWSFVTTFAYGDAPPVSAFGKVLAVLFSMFGVLFASFPITVIVENFTKVYDEFKGKKQDGDEAGKRKSRTFVLIGKIPVLVGSFKRERKNDQSK